MTYCGWIGKSPSNVDKFEDSEMTNCRCIEKSPSNSCLPRLVFLFSTPDSSQLKQKSKSRSVYMGQALFQTGFCVFDLFP